MSEDGKKADKTSVWDIPVPEGWVRLANGSLVHESAVREADALRSALVEGLVRRATGEAAVIQRFFAEAHGELLAFCELSAERFGTRWGETESFSMQSLCGRFKVVCDCDATIALNESVAVARTLLDECVTEWTTGGKPQAAALVRDTFRPTKHGGISLARLLSLLRHREAPEFREDGRFQRVCEAIEAALQPTGKRRYLRFYARRTPADKWDLVEFGA